MIAGLGRQLLFKRERRCGRGSQKRPVRRPRRVLRLPLLGATGAPRGSHRAPSAGLQRPLATPHRPGPARRLGVRSRRALLAALVLGSRSPALSPRRRSPGGRARWRPPRGRRLLIRAPRRRAGSTPRRPTWSAETVRCGLCSALSALTERGRGQAASRGRAHLAPAVPEPAGVWGPCALRTPQRPLPWVLGTRASSPRARTAGKGTGVGWLRVEEGTPY